MRFQLPIARGGAPSLLPLFAERPSHPSVPLGNDLAVTRRRGQGRPLVGACALPLTAASTMARSRRSQGRAYTRVALLIVVGVILLVSLVTPTHAQMAAKRMPAHSERFGAFVTEAAQHFGIPAVWIRAIMHVESRGNRRAISPKGAMVVMQLMPDTQTETRYDAAGIAHCVFVGVDVDWGHALMWSAAQSLHRKASQKGRRSADRL